MPTRRSAAGMSRTGDQRLAHMADKFSILRSVIHPQIVISPLAEAPNAEQPLAVLDLRQERNAHSLGDGHRIVYGVAGSGKTVILIARARLVAQDPNKQILLLCFNRALAE